MFWLKHRPRRRDGAAACLPPLVSAEPRHSRQRGRRPRVLCPSAALGVLMLLLPARSWAAPDGRISSFEEASLIRLLDPVEGTFGSPSWDVQGVYFSLDMSFLDVGIDTVGVFDPDSSYGRPSGSLAQASVWMEFREVPAGTVQTVRIIPTETTVEVTINGQPVPYYPDPWHRCYVYTGRDLEVSMGRALLEYFVLTALAPAIPWPPNERMRISGEIDFRLILDDGGPGPHDKVVGRLPEPGTLLLVAMGCPALLRRRRR